MDNRSFINLLQKAASIQNYVNSPLKEKEFLFQLLNLPDFDGTTKNLPPKSMYIIDKIMIRYISNFFFF